MAHNAKIYKLLENAKPVAFPQFLSWFDWIDENIKLDCPIAISADRRQLFAIRGVLARYGKAHPEFSLSTSYDWDNEIFRVVRTLKRQKDEKD